MHPGKWHVRNYMSITTLRTTYMVLGKFAPPASSAAKTAKDTNFSFYTMSVQYMSVQYMSVQYMSVQSICNKNPAKVARRSQFTMRNLLLRKVIIIICLPTLPIYEKFPTYVQRILIYLGTYLIWASFAKSTL